MSKGNTVFNSDAIDAIRADYEKVHSAVVSLHSIYWDLNTKISKKGYDNHREQMADAAMLGHLAEAVRLLHDAKTKIFAI